MERQRRLQHVLRTGMAAAPALRGSRGVVAGGSVGVGLVDLPDELRRRVTSLFDDKNLCESLSFYARTSTQARDDVQALLDAPGSVALIQRFWQSMALRTGLEDDGFHAVSTKPDLLPRFQQAQLEENLTELRPGSEIIDFDMNEFKKLAIEQAEVELPLPGWLQTPDDARTLLKKACKNVAVRRYMAVVGSLLAANDNLLGSYCEGLFVGGYNRNDVVHRRYFRLLPQVTEEMLRAHMQLISDASSLFHALDNGDPTADYEYFGLHTASVRQHSIAADYVARGQLGFHRPKHDCMVLKWFQAMARHAMSRHGERHGESLYGAFAPTETDTPTLRMRQLATAMRDVKMRLDAIRGPVVP